ncbi:glycine--tRNA ligase subunit beta [Psittacicella melopsittaci]|uniref:Glycine--tRNA ligase beta subunit n=1 Tax=Psittacicella melopsittaci TaxID=2028576 RepID=A0A3A1Y5N8_9GAMM|nr:glycine--tRNA ligase subunit beta [Psittacicella melopsittaci]RIY32586.1 glycine--tRNA ligase subunit beta [Psittacicella melopsittaci]
MTELNKHSFLVELGTEELPPSDLKNISAGFTDALVLALHKANVAYDEIESFATPRRIAVYIKGLNSVANSQLVEKRGPAKAACFNEDGSLSKAAQGWLKANNLEFSQVSFLETDKGAWLYYSFEQPGASSEEILPQAVAEALAGIPISKGMRWGNHDFTFIRPVHTFTMLLDDKVLEGTAFGVKSDRKIYGHRFLGTKEFTLNHADEYQSRLLAEGSVVASFAERRKMIVNNVKKLASQYNGYVNLEDDLVDEITSLVEYPNVLIANFEKEFLKVPKEALIHTMEGDQRYFPLFADNKFTQLLPHFIFVSNVTPKDPSLIIAGNEKVIRPRLSDAKFFYEQDLKKPLEDLLPRLKMVVFQNQLGTVYNKTLRLEKLALVLAEKLKGNTTFAQRAARLAKCDLMTNMVFEFTDTQGIMGMYYAQAAGEEKEVARALFEQYLPRFSGDQLPTTLTGSILSLADKLDTLVGIFGINQPPKGAKDPFALRRAAISILRILTENGFNLSLGSLVQATIEVYGDKLTVPADKLKEDILSFVNGRVKALYEEQGYAIDEIQSVQNLNIDNPYDFFLRLKAVHDFKSNLACEDLAAANKRVNNFLSKSDFDNNAKVDETLFETDEEVNLFQDLLVLEERCLPLYRAQEYMKILSELASVREDINAFFDNVVVNAENELVKANRYALLNKLQLLFSLVADISTLNY